MKSTDLITEYEDNDRIAHIEETTNYPGLVYIEASRDDMPFTLMGELMDNPNLYVWNIGVAKSGKPCMFVGDTN